MLEINTSKIKNTVTFTVDKQSLKEAKDAIKSVQTFAEGLEPSLNMRKIKRQMKEIEAYARRMQKNLPPHGGGSGTPPVPPGSGGGRPPAGSGGAGKPPKQTSEQKAAIRAAKRNETANMKMENFGYRAGQFGKADVATLEQARRIVEQTVDLYRQEKISLQRVNQTMSHQLDSLRRSHREKVSDIEDEVRGRRRVRRELEAEAKTRIRIRERSRKDRERAEKRERDARLRDRTRRYERLKEGGLSLSPGMIGGALIGAGLVEGISRLNETMSRSAERTNMISRGAQNVQTNPNSILAMESWGRVNGVDSANIIKAIDNIKDVRERLGNSAMNSKFDEKSGKWKGGDSGINDIMNQFGWGIEDVKKFQNRPLDFVQATVNEGQRRGMNSAQIGRLMENLGDDLMHYQRMFLDNGAEYMKMVDQLTKTGGALTNQQIEAAQNYTVLSEKMNQFGNGFSAQLVVGFMDAMKGAPDFEKNVPLFMSAAESIGKSAGEMAVALAQLASWIAEVIPDYSKSKIANDTFLGMDYYEDSWLARMIGHGRGFMDSMGTLNTIPGVQNPNLMAGTAALGPNQVGIGNSWNSINPYSFAANQGGPLDPNAYRPGQSPLMIQNTLTVPNDSFQITITPDSYGMNQFFDAKLDAFGTSYTQGLILQTSSGQSSTGG